MDQSLVSMEEEDNTGWQTVTQLTTRPADIKTEVKAVLQEEPTINEGLAGALKLAKQKGDVLSSYLSCLVLLYSSLPHTPLSAAQCEVLTEECCCGVVGFLQRVLSVD